MEPSKEQHSFFALPVWPRYGKQKPQRKRRRSDPDPELPPGGSRPSTPLKPQAHEAPQTGWTPINDSSPLPSSLPPIGFTSPDEQLQRENREGSDSDADSEDEHSNPTFRCGGHTKRFAEILIGHNLPIPPREPYSLRIKHLTVITTVLYRSLMEGDFARASRAYGLLIRCKDVDVRRMWGIGLEILLRRPEFNARVGDEEDRPAGGEEDEEEKEENRSPKSKHKTRPSPENIAKAIEFLNRLILFYPYHRRVHIHHPAIVSATKSASTTKKTKRRLKPSVLEFYPAFFTLLIKCSPYSEDPRPAFDKNQILERNPELHPEKIKEQLESLMMTPPWSDILSLWLLRGMVCNWISDLERGKNGDKGKRERIKMEARQCFGKVKEKGATIPEGVEWGDDEDEGEEEDGEDGEEQNGDDVDIGSEDGSDRGYES